VAAAVGTLTPPEPTGIPNPAAYSRDTDPMTQVSRPPRTGWWRFFLAAVAAALVALLGATTASAATLPEVETRVGASPVFAAYVVGVHESITAGQRWGHAPPQAGTAVGFGVAAKIVLGLKAQGLEATAAKVGGRTLLKDPEWMATLQEAVGDPSTKFTVSVDGLSGSSTYSQVMSAAQRGAAGTGGYTDWELAQLYQAGRLGDTTFVSGGSVIPNPFVP